MSMQTAIGPEHVILYAAADHSERALTTALAANRRINVLHADTLPHAVGLLDRHAVGLILLGHDCAPADADALCRRARQGGVPARLVQIVDGPARVGIDAGESRQGPDLVLSASLPPAELAAVLQALLRARGPERHDAEPYGAGPHDAQSRAADFPYVRCDDARRNDTMGGNDAGAQAGGRLRRFIAAMPAPMAMFDRNMCYLAVSEAFRTAYRLPEAELVGRCHYEVFPDIPERWRAVHRRCLEGATERCDEDPFPRADGTLDWVRWEIRPWHDRNGRVGGIVLFLEDITARKTAENALRLVAQRYSMALRGLPVVVFEQDLDLRYTWIDNAAPDYQPVEVIGRTDFGIFDHADDAAVTMALKRQVIETGVGLRQDVRIRHRDGDRFFDLAIEPLRDGAGAITGVTCAAVDTTERRRMEAALQASEALLRAVLEQIPAAITILAPPDGALVIRSHYCDAVFGAPDAAWQADPGMARQAAEHPDGRPYAADAYPGWRALHHGETVLAEPMRYRRTDGRLVDLEVFAAPVRDAAGNIIAAVAAAFDVSERREAERLLAQSHAELEVRVAERTHALGEAAHELASEMQRRSQAQAALLQGQKLDALGQMTSGIAHDFRNVLSAVSGSYELLRARITDARLLPIVGRGEKAVERADRLVRQLLAFASQQELRPEIVVLRDLLCGFKEFSRHALGSGRACEIDVAADAWPVVADSGQLEVALLNLVVNARDAMPDGGIIRITARNLPRAAAVPPLPAKDCLVISVQDTGGGMPPEVAARAAEPFFTTKQAGRGTGLGLAMVDDFARRSGGAIRIESAVGVGTTVDIILPRADTCQAPEAGTVTVTVAGAEVARHGNAVILLVDDDEPLRGVTAMFLRDLGYSVVEAGSAEAAYTLVHSVDSLNLVITDLVMSGASGLALADRLKAERPGLPLVFISGHPEQAAMARDTVLHKPFSRDELARTILRKLGRSVETAAG